VTAVDAFFGTYLVNPVAKVLFFNLADPYAAWIKLIGGELPEGYVPSKLSFPFIVAWLFVGAVFFTLRMGFINVRAFWHAIRLTKGDYDTPHSAGEVSHFQALSSALSGTVGLGNIGGVAIAIGTGGPGATVWLIVAGLLGMSSKFVECSLGQLYREVDADGRVSGGPMRYLSEGLRQRGLGSLGMVLAVVFAVFCILASFGGGCAYQVNQSLQVVSQRLQADFGLTDQQLTYVNLAYGLVMAALVGLVIIGGIRRIAATAARIVPLMCAVYVACCLAVLIMQFQHIGSAVQLMIDGAFTSKAGFGALLGILFIGIQRAAFSNEAGVGSAAIAHSAAKTDEPISEGIVALLEPFIDTVVVCTMTALAVVIVIYVPGHTLVEGAIAPIDEPAIQAMVQGNQGAAVTNEAFMRGGFGWFSYVLLVCVVMFAYSTMISWSYYGERCWSYLFGPSTAMIYKIAFLIFVVLGSVITATNVLDFSDLMILAMSFPNIIGLYILSGEVKRRLNDYWGRVKSGEIAPVSKDAR
jgi:AGCS family alanine or glycine:cation symporter